MFTLIHNKSKSKSKFILVKLIIRNLDFKSLKTELNQNLSKFRVAQL